MISVVVPVYNAREYIESTVHSILQQSYDDFELILVDDGSRDGSGEICDNLSSKDSRIKVIHKENGGVSSARNVGIDEAKGEYICFIDADDSVERDLLECLVKNATRYDVDISCCGIAQISLEKKETHVGSSELKVRINNVEELFQKFFSDALYKEVLYGPYNKIIRTSIVKEVRFNTKYTIAEDLLFNFECIEKSTGFYFETRPLYKYIKRDNSITTTAFSTKNFDYIYVSDLLFDKCQKKHMSALEAARVWVWVNKINICRELAYRRKMRKDYNAFFSSCMDFCRKNKEHVWGKLAPRAKLAFILLNAFPDVFTIEAAILRIIK